MSESTLTMSDVVGFIQDNTTKDDLDVVIEAVKTRRTLLRNQAAAEVREGQKVTLTDIKPKYLQGLCGTVKTIDRSGRTPAAVVTLDEESTKTLAFSSPKYRSLANRNSYDFNGVPLSCCKPVA